MGNYYEGSLRFELKDFPGKVLRLLYFLDGRGESQNTSIPEEFKDIEFLHHPNWKYATFEMYQDKELYTLYVRFCMKGYRIEFDLGQSIVDYFKPYCVIEKDNPFGYLGSVEDEDDTYFKMFYANDDAVKEEQKKRNNICNGCEWYNPSEVPLCKDYSICKRAYCLGRSGFSAEGS